MTSRFSFDASSVPLRQDGAADSEHLAAEDRFVLDCVDGVSSVEELAMMLAMNEQEVIETLERLAAQGRIQAPISSDDAPARELQATADFAVADLAKAVESASAKPVDQAHSAQSSASEAARTKENPVVDAPAAAVADPDALSPEEGEALVEALLFDADEQDTAQFDAVEEAKSRDEAEDEDAAASSTMRFTVPTAVVDDPKVPPLPPPASQTSQTAGTLPPKKTKPPTLPAPPKRPGPPPSPEAKPKDGEHISLDTPRRHLDPTWWKGMGEIEEPDEGLTSREISLSASLPTSRGSGPKDVHRRDHSITDRIEIDPVSFTEPMQRPTNGFEELNVGSGSYPRQTFERPPGGFIGGIRGLSDPERDTSEVDVLPAGDTDRASLDTEHETGPVGFVDEVAHTRGERAPLLPDVEVEDGWDASSAAATDPNAPWAEEPLAASLRADKGGWTLEEARCVSYYLRLIESGTYYEIFGISSNANGSQIAQAANSVRKCLRVDALKARASNAGIEALVSVKRGTERALDVLLRPDARAQYDAALQALAAFKL